MTLDQYFNSLKDHEFYSDNFKAAIAAAFNAGFTAGEQNIKNNMMDYISRAQEKLLDSTPKVPQVIYPPNGEFYSVLVTFSRELSYEEKNRAQDIAEYWGSIPYCGENFGCAWSLYVLEISQDITKSTSDDWGSRNVLELLLDYLQNGTPVRTSNRAGSKTKGTQAINGLGNIVSKIEAF